MYGWCCKSTVTMRDRVARSRERPALSWRGAPQVAQRPAKVLFAGKHACHAIEGLADPDLLIRGDRLFGCFCSVLRSNPNGERRGAAPRRRSAAASRNSDTSRTLLS